MIRRPPRSTLDRSSAASDVYKRQHDGIAEMRAEEEFGGEIADGAGSAGLVSFGGQHPCLLYTSPSPRDRTRSRMPSSA